MIWLILSIVLGLFIIRVSGNKNLYNPFYCYNIVGISILIISILKLLKLLVK